MTTTTHATKPRGHDMADDPIGTVRREDFESGHSIWVRLDADATPGNEWSCVWSTYWSNIGCTRSPAAVADDLVIGAVPGTPAAAGLLAAPAAQPAPFTDLTARLAAADAGWGLASGDGPSNPDYIRFLAQQLDAFEDHASPAAPADDEATRAITEVAEELSKAQVKFAPFNSTHEGYAVILEELDELWAEVKANDIPRSIEEAVQVAAMALRYIVDCRAALAALREGQQQ